MVGGFHSRGALDREIAGMDVQCITASMYACTVIHVNEKHNLYERLHVRYTVSVTFTLYIYMYYLILVHSIQQHIYTYVHVLAHGLMYNCM